MPENNSHSTCNIPQTSPIVPHADPIWRRSGINGSTHNRATFVSPVYDQLEANIPKMLMQHSTHPFPDSTQLFPTAAQIEEYLVSYAEPVSHLVQWETQLLSALPFTSPAGETTWSLTTRHLSTNAHQTSTYDALLIASGHYNIPFLPEIPRIAAWNAANPSRITHAKAYSSPDAFAGKKVLLIGNGPSAIDIAAQISHTCAPPLLISTRSDPNPVFRLPTAHYVGPIAEFLPADPATPAAIRMASGALLTHLDAVIFCTGYIYSYPFLPQGVPPVRPAGAVPDAPVHPAFSTHPLITSGDRVHHVYQHLFWAALPSLAFLVLPWNIVPFPLAEAQAAVVARVWAGRRALPAQEAMDRWEREGEEAWGRGKAFHRMPPPRDGLYLNALGEWAAGGEEAGERLPVGGERAKEGTTVGGERARKGVTVEEKTEKTNDGPLPPPHWDGRMFWIRRSVAAIKKAFMERGAARRSVTTLEELGFTYDAARDDDGR